MAQKTFLIKSVKNIKDQLQDRLDVVNDLIDELNAGATATSVPFKHRHISAKQSANKIKNRLEKAMELMDEECGDNQLANPYTTQN